MTFAIFDSNASLVASYNDRGKARTALEQIARQDPGAIEEYAMFEFDRAGRPVGNALTGADLGVHA